MKQLIKIKNSNDFFEVNNIYCIGKNYLEHINEFDNKEIPKDPVVFLKPNSAILDNHEKIIIPAINGKNISENLQNEVEFVIAISKDGENIHEDKTEEYILGYAIGLDMTLRDVQSKAKEKGLPWSVSKGFKTSAPISEIIPKELVKNPMNLDFDLYVNDKRIQFTNTSLMIFNIYKLISYISSIFSIAKGDLIFTGTPAGISKLKSGDKLKAKLEDYLTLEIQVE
ncbi:MAG: fumarylacetoacetate hydrolase family protein [Ignavibacteria bacterium]|nr:fumarylacetoacetate hydrolase family protein [Ignavibacteria bacterium]